MLYGNLRENKIRFINFITKIKESFKKDYRTRKSIVAFERVFEDLPKNPFCLSIGGGPKRPHHLFTNLNIESFQNVEIVGDAHALPFSDSSVDAIHCEAVIEHLINPYQAVKEMHRVLKGGKRAYICTPFMQSYHGYPYHYQNFTLLGHELLFKNNGFHIIDSGTCVGPVNAMVALVSKFISEYFPVYFKYPAMAAWFVFGQFLKPIDRSINKKDNSYKMASTTYLLVEKRS